MFYVPIVRSLTHMYHFGSYCRTYKAAYSRARYYARKYFDPLTVSVIVLALSSAEYRAHPGAPCTRKCPTDLLSTCDTRIWASAELFNPSTKE